MKNQNDPNKYWQPFTRWQRFCLLIHVRISILLCALTLTMFVEWFGAILAGAMKKLHSVHEPSWHTSTLGLMTVFATLTLLSFFGLIRARVKAKALLEFEECSVVYWLERTVWRASKPLERGERVPNNESMLFSAIVPLKKGRKGALYFRDPRIKGSELKEIKTDWTIELVSADLEAGDARVRLVSNGVDEVMFVSIALELLYQLACESIVTRNQFQALRTTSKRLMNCRAEIEDLKSQLRKEQDARNAAELGLRDALDAGANTVLRLRNKGQVGRSSAVKKIADEATEALVRLLPESNQTAVRLRTAQLVSDASSKPREKRPAANTQA